MPNGNGQNAALFGLITSPVIKVGLAVFLFAASLGANWGFVKWTTTDHERRIVKVETQAVSADEFRRGQEQTQKQLDQILREVQRANDRIDRLMQRDRAGK